MTCNDCRWKTEKKDCPWNYDYQNTDYAEDCIDFRNVNRTEDAFLDDKLNSLKAEIDDLSKLEEV